MATYPTNPPGSTLEAIQQKVRRLTRSPSEAQLTTDDLNNYINTFVIYDFPAHLRTFQLRQPFSFTCNPYQDQYPLDIASYAGAINASQNALYDFQNKYLAIHKPVYVGGFETYYSQDRQEFYRHYPINSFIQTIGVNGDGVTTTYSGTVQFGGTQNQSLIANQAFSILKRNVLFSSIDVNGNGLSMVDVPVVDSTTGGETIWGNLYVSGTTPVIPYTEPNATPIPIPTASPPYTQDLIANNFINYVTGEFTVTFPVAPYPGVAINSQTTPLIPSRPFGMLMYNNTLILRPVPDQPYIVSFEVDARPTQLLVQNSIPQLNELWMYIAYGTSKYVFEDRMDVDSVAAIMPEFKTQEALCLRRTLVQLTNARASTIYLGTTGEGSDFNAGWGYGGTF